MNEDLDALKEKIVPCLKTLFSIDPTEHGAEHALRVYKMSLLLAENHPCNRKRLLLISLLHDVDDKKFFVGEEYPHAKAIMEKCVIALEEQVEVIMAIKDISFKGSDSHSPSSIEGKIVQDADRLDALGAIGIARAFAYGGNKNRSIYDPSSKAKEGMNEEEYRTNVGSSVNHFYEKLLLLEGMMNLSEAKSIAHKRTMFMKKFLDEFYKEWEQKDFPSVSKETIFDNARRND